MWVDESPSWDVLFGRTFQDWEMEVFLFFEKYILLRLSKGGRTALCGEMRRMGGFQLNPIIDFLRDRMVVVFQHPRCGFKQSPQKYHFIICQEKSLTIDNLQMRAFLSFAKGMWKWWTIY